MKKRFSMLLVLAMTMGLVASGCGNKEESKETVGKDKVVAQKEEKEGKKSSRWFCGKSNANGYFQLEYFI